MSSIETVDYQFDVGPDRTIRGTIHLPADSSAAPVVVFCHGFKGFKDWGGWAHLGDRIAAAGFVLNRFTFSKAGVATSTERHDEPEKFATNTYGDEIDDLAIVLARRSEWGVPAARLADSVGVIGHSRGGFVTLLAAGENPAIDAVVTIAAPARGIRFTPEQIAHWRESGAIEVPNARTGQVLTIDRAVLEDTEAKIETRYSMERAVAARPVPTLVIHGDADPVVAFSDAETITNAIPHDDKELLRLPGGDHTLGTRHPFAGTTPDFERAIDASISWFERTLNR